MKKSQFSPTQIASMHKEIVGGNTAEEINRKHGVSGWPPYQKNQFNFGRSKGGALIIGDANEAIDKILAMQEMFGLTRFSAHLDVGGPSHKLMMKLIETFGNNIALKIREALKK